jgi:hypothetical protein
MNCTCANDQDALNQGFGWCDESRSTCLPGEDPAGTCAGTAAQTCTTFKPTCPAGQVATLFDGCYTGQCRDYAACDLPPVCEDITDEANCLGRSDCQPVYDGHDCHLSGSTTACNPGDMNCVCDGGSTFGRCKSPS